MSNINELEAAYRAACDAVVDEEREYKLMRRRITKLEDAAWEAWRELREARQAADEVTP